MTRERKDTIISIPKDTLDKLHAVGDRLEQRNGFRPTNAQIIAYLVMLDECQPS